MPKETLLLIAVFVPVAGAFLLPLLGMKFPRLRNLFALGLVLAALVASSLLLPVVLSGSPVSLNISLPLGFNFILYADRLAVFMAMVSSLISTVIVCYSFGYISHYNHQNEYYLMVVLFLGAMMGLVFSANLILMYVFWEITAITSWRLIGFSRQKEHVLRADKAFLVTALGAVLMLAGFIRLFQETGTFDLAGIHSAFISGQVSSPTAILILAGIFSKSATLPFHTWLPDAGVAPSPVTALLHAAVLVKIGVYAFARIFIVSMPLGEPLQSAVICLAGLSMIISAACALVETDLKRIIAYSTISQIGFIFLGLATASPIGIAGGLLYILMHGLAKGGLFLCAGIVEQNAKTKNINELGGLIRTMPVTAISFLLCAFSIMGIPPMGGFFSKYMVFSAAVRSGNLWIVVLFLAGAVLTIMYLLRVFQAVFLGELKPVGVKEGSRLMVVSVATLAVLSLALGIFARYPISLVKQVLQQMVMR